MFEDLQQCKQSAAAEAVARIDNGMTVGLGTGSTSVWAIESLAKRIREGLCIKAVASSFRSEDQAKKLGIQVTPFSEVNAIDVYIDGADEIDNNLNLVKGGGGALLREKILAFHAKEFIVIADSSKRVENLGRFPLPVEVVPFGLELTIKQLQKLGCTISLRVDNGKAYTTDNRNLIVDCDFKKIENVQQLHDAINSIPGVVENGLFLKTMVTKVIIGYNKGSVEVNRSRSYQHA
ncbi:MAG TPA: ribose-5-phosphate isomerase RpiA [Flavisolibacter sp.]|nr:ribose-5-phosphate isomerase RpiA [Flavisolibacter sp.]